MKAMESRFPNYFVHIRRPDLTHAVVSLHDAVAVIASDTWETIPSQDPMLVPPG